MAAIACQEMAFQRLRSPVMNEYHFKLILYRKFVKRIRNKLHKLPLKGSNKPRTFIAFKYIHTKVYMIISLYLLSKIGQTFAQIGKHPIFFLDPSFILIPLE